ncbi:unnamed protein product [Pipistrellus nathusii]|uniref:Uncharacterized protein n=1 Tax=Pipistrellus nathusii TaxID=59473 RepID=A0ABP0A0H9_PIPNA
MSAHKGSRKWCFRGTHGVQCTESSSSKTAQSRWSVAGCQHEIPAPCHADPNTGCWSVLRTYGWHPPNWASHVVLKVTLPRARSSFSLTDRWAASLIPMLSGLCLCQIQHHHLIRRA